MYSLGGLLISADDDMRPHTLMEHSPESLEPDEVCRGRLHNPGENGYVRKSFDIVTSFVDVLGKRVAANLQKAFYAFEPDFFQHNLVRIMDDVVSVIKGSLELWPALIEICYFQKGRKGLPQIRVNNHRKLAA